MQSDFTLMARVFDGGQSTPIATAEFVLSGPVGPPRLMLNEYSAVDVGSYLGGGTAADLANGTDTALGRVLGNGGDWFELVVLEDLLDIRGWAVEVWSETGGAQQRSARLVFSDDPLLASLRSGTILTVSEDIVDDVSYLPQTGDWNINLQANDADQGGYFTAASQTDFTIDNRDTQIAIIDELGQPEALRTGEGTAPNAGVSSTEVFKFEGAPNENVAPDNGLYNDGTSSTWGLPNLFGGGAQVQDLSGLRIEFGDANCDGTSGIVDALVIAQYEVGNRTNADCPLPDPLTQIFAAGGDVNNDGSTNIIDSLLISQCEVGINNIFCP